jgi:hypothetical protein
MNKQEARSIAIKYLSDAAYSAYDILSKEVVDDAGTLSEGGYIDSEFDKINKELDCVMKRVFKMELKNQPK